MTQTITIRFTVAARADTAEIHRIRNFAEDLHRALTQHHVGHVNNIDAAVSTVEVTIASRRHLGTVKQLTNQILRQHHLSETVHWEC